MDRDSLATETWFKPAFFLKCKNAAVKALLVEFAGQQKQLLFRPAYFQRSNNKKNLGKW
jgi:hypothetical protein